MTIGLWGAAMLLALASPGTARYGDALLASRVKHEPHLLYAAIDLAGEKSLHFEAGRKAGDEGGVRVALADALGQPAGILSLAFDAKVSPDAAKRRGAAIAAFLSRRFYAPSLLGEAAPLVAGTPRSRLGQALVERQLSLRPGLVTIALHVALPGRPNAIIASNFGRIGKAADEDDSNVIDHGAILQEVTNGGRRLAVELPMLDRGGRVIGALSTSFLLGPDGRDAAYRAALEVRDDLARAIGSLDSLEASIGEEE
jgi:iron complex outermembrane receptor protein